MHSNKCLLQSLDIISTYSNSVCTGNLNIFVGHLNMKEILFDSKVITGNFEAKKNPFDRRDPNVGHHTLQTTDLWGPVGYLCNYYE